MSDLYCAEAKEGGDDDIWDDTKLNEAYDKALRIANEVVAKRVAMATNTQEKDKDEEEDVEEKKKENFDRANYDPKAARREKNRRNRLKPKKVPIEDLRVGGPCRAVFDEDGIEYEAYIISIISNTQCVIRFIGYENSQLVSIESLHKTHGEKVMRKQIDDAFDYYMERKEMPRENRTPSPGSNMELLAPDPYFVFKPPEPVDDDPHKFNEFGLPEHPVFTPDASAMKDEFTDIPLPPPPTVRWKGKRKAEEDKAISSMLLSWYMSGYYTGLYQGMKSERQQRQKKQGQSEVSG